MTEYMEKEMARPQPKQKRYSSTSDHFHGRRWPRLCVRPSISGHEDESMIKMKQVGCIVLLLTVATTIGYSQETTAGHSQGTISEYVAPSEAVPKGKAPRMQVQLLSADDPTKQYAVIFYAGDEAFSGLLEFAQKYHVTSAHFTAIGAVSGATLGWFDPQRKMYKKIPVMSQHEVIGMSGDIALYQGKPVVHTHMMLGASDGTTLAGHVLAAYVSPTLEVMVTVDPVAMQKRFDPETDLTLIDPSSK
jgi:predicted DNA-binding protein with PD1-like motif